MNVRVDPTRIELRGSSVCSWSSHACHSILGAGPDGRACFGYAEVALPGWLWPMGSLAR